MPCYGIKAKNKASKPLKHKNFSTRRKNILKQRFAKIIALALAVIMIVTAFPVSAYTGAQDPANANDSKAAKDFLDWISRPIDQFKPNNPAQTMDYNVLGGTCVHVDAPRGALPADTELDVVSITDLDAVQDAFNDASDERGHVFAAVDINFINNGEEVDPRKPVTVILDDSIIANIENIRLVHFKGDADEIGSAEMEIVDQFYVSGQTITFDAEDFSVYAVIGDATGENARLKVRFFHHDTDTTDEQAVYTVYVTQRDIAVLDTIIADPELPTVASGELFGGWSVGNTYTDADIDGQHTIDYIREQVAARLASPVTEGQTFDVYAMVFKFFNIAYVDEVGGTTLGTEVIFSKESSIQYTLFQQYAPYEQGYRFIGWQKDDGDDTVYPNNTEVTIQNTYTTIRAQVQKGYWISFVESPATSNDRYKGATYNAPVFCPNGVIPSNARPANPVLAGYDFGNWYKNFNAGSTAATDSWTDQFNFSGTISQDTTVYAKWTLKTSVPYTLIVWKQNVNDNKNAADADKTYDFAFSTTLFTAPNTAISSLDLNYYKTLHAKESNGNAQYINDDTDGTGTWYDFHGFHFGRGAVSSSSGVTTVLPNGTTVVNIYWDRDLVTLNFYKPTYAPATFSSSSSTTYYVLVNGKYYSIDWSSSSYYYYEISQSSMSSSNATSYSNTIYYCFSTNGDLYRVWYTGGRWVYGTSSSNYAALPSNTPVYRSVSSSSSVYTVNYNTLLTSFDGLYGSTLQKNGYTWPEDYWWYDTLTNNKPSGTRTTFLDAFLPTTDTTTVNYYGETSTGALNIRFYKQDYNNTSNYTLADTVSATENGIWYFSDKFNGFHLSAYSLSSANGPWTNIGELMRIVDNYDSSTGTHNYVIVTEGGNLYYDADPETDGFQALDLTSDLYILFDRNQYRVTYMVGSYVDGRGNTITGPMTGELAKSSAIYYEDSIASCGSYDPIAAGKFTDDSFIFEGWFVDPGCTTAYDFTGKTMPIDGVTVYAKFRQREYRVFLEPNLPTDPNFSVVWTSTGQAMNFRIAYLGQISDGQPIGAKDANNGYVLVGWYLDEECTEPFNFETKLNDGIAEDYTNKLTEDQNRPWITKKITLYAKWRKVLDGANGITVVYNAIEQENTAGKTGTFAQETGTPTIWEDPLRYMDTASALARTASTPDDTENYQFLYWEILDQSGNPVQVNGEDYKIYPGQLFDIDAQYAVEETITLNPVYGETGTKSGAPSIKADNGKTYELVTSALTDWSGNYVITHGSYSSTSDMYVFTGVSGSAGGTNIENSSNTTAFASSGITLSGNTLTNVDNSYVVTLDKQGSYYTIKSVSTGAYYGLNSSSYLYAYSSYNSTYCNWTPNVNSSYQAQLKCSTGSTPYFSWSSSYSYFWSGSSSNANVLYLWKEVDSSSTTEGVTYVLANTIEAGQDYIIAISTHAVTNSVYNTNTNRYLNATTVTVNSDNTVTIPAGTESSLLWRAGGSSSGWTFYNQAVGKYIGLNPEDSYWLTLTTNSWEWLYNGTDLDNQCTESANAYSSTEYYQYLSYDSTHSDFTTSAGTGQNVKFYKRVDNSNVAKHTLTINYVYANGTTAHEPYTAEIAEGEPYTVASPAIDGYTPTPETVQGVMGQENVTAVVTYNEAGHWEWKPTTTITPNEDYLIGFVVGNDVYLIMNYNPNGVSSNNYYYGSDYSGYTVKAVRNGEVVTGCTGWSTDLDNCVWSFSTAQGGIITSGRDSTYHLTAYYNSDADLRPTNQTGSSYLYNNWVYQDHKLSHYYSSSVTKYAKYTASVSSYSNFCNASTSYDSTNGYVQLYHKEWVEPQTTQYYTVTFVDGCPGANNAVIGTDTVEAGTAATAPNPPDHSAEYYFFDHWNVDFSEVNGDMTVTAIYRYERTGYYTVTFKDWNGAVIDTQEVEQGHDAVAPADPVRDNYIFAGWDKDFTNVQQNLVVYATYTKAVTKTYTLTLRAVYGPKTPLKKTHITWHANNTSGEYKNSVDVVINENIDIEFPEGTDGAKVSWTAGGDLVWEDHVFLGWARLDIGDPDTNTIDSQYKPTITVDGEEVPNPDYVKEWPLNEDDLFLKYVPAEGNEEAYFMAKFGDVWKKADAVAADELDPYHGMFAVWANVFYVYHSGTNQVEKIVYTNNKFVDPDTNQFTATYNLAKTTTSGYLYAGYYKYYDGVSSKFNIEQGAKVMTWNDVKVSWNNGELVKDDSWKQTKHDDTPENGTAAKAYNGYNVKWTAVPYSKDADNHYLYGTELSPVAGMTYYIKEVPADKYLRPYLHYTYFLDSGSISTAWLISDVDLSYTDYIETGYVVTTANDAAEHIVRSLTITTTHGNSTQTLSAMSLFRTRGYLNYLTVINRGSNGQPTVSMLNDGDSVAQYWVTPDGLRVTGYAVRTYKGLANFNTVGIDTQSDSIANYSLTKWN